MVGAEISYYQLWRGCAASRSHSSSADVNILEKLVTSLAATTSCPADADADADGDTPTEHPVSGYSVELSATPKLVLAHYAKTLLERVSATLVGYKSKAVESRCTSEAILWELLAKLLLLPDCQGGVPAVGSILGAAIAACSSTDKAGLCVRLPSAVATVVEALDSHFSDLFRKQLNTIIALAKAAVDAAAVDLQWAQLAQYTLLCVSRIFIDHQNQRKIFTLICNELLLPVCAFSFSEEICPISEAKTGLSAVALQALDAVLFHTEGIQCICDLVMSEAAQASSDGSGTRSVSGLSKGHKDFRSYQWRIFQVLEGAVDGCDGKEACGALAAGPWLLGRFTAALKRHRRMRAAESAARAARKQNEVTHNKRPGAIEFDFFTLLARPIMKVLRGEVVPGHKGALGSVAEGKRKRSRSSAEGSEVSGTAKKQKLNCGAYFATLPKWGRYAEGMASLLDAVRNLEVYRPTEDTSGHNLAFLTEIAEAAIQSSRESASAKEMLSAAKLIGSLADLEHKALGNNFAGVWPVIFGTAESPEKGIEVAANVAATFVKAYAELRQLELLLQSLTEAVSGGISVEASRAFCSQACLEALQKALEHLPPGQATQIVSFSGDTLSKLRCDGAHMAANEALTALCIICLRGLPVSLPTSQAVASGIEQMLQDPLAGLLKPILTEICQKPLQESASSPSLMASLLEIYSSALRTHARCVGLHPQIASLPGQSKGDAINQVEDRAAMALGYFAAVGASDEELLGAVDSEGAAGGDEGGGRSTALSALSQHFSTTGAAQTSYSERLRLAVATCTIQHMEVLEERLLRHRFACPLIKSDSPQDVDKQDCEVLPEREDEVQAKLADLAETLVRPSLREGHTADESVFHSPADCLQEEVMSNARLLLPWLNPQTGSQVLGCMLAIALTNRDTGARALETLLQENSPQICQAFAAAAIDMFRELLWKSVGGKRTRKGTGVKALQSLALLNESTLLSAESLREVLEAGQVLDRTLPAMACEQEEGLRDVTALAEILAGLSIQHVAIRPVQLMLHAMLFVLAVLMDLDCSPAPNPNQIGKKSNKRKASGDATGFSFRNQHCSGNSNPDCLMHARERVVKLIARLVDGVADAGCSLIVELGPACFSLLLSVEASAGRSPRRIAAVVTHLASITQRLTAFCLGVRGAAADQSSLEDPASASHNTVSDRIKEFTGCLVGTLRSCRKGEVGLKNSALLEAISAGTLSAWEALKGKSRRRKSNIVSRPSQPQRHVVDVDTLSTFTSKLRKAARHAHAGAFNRLAGISLGLEQPSPELLMDAATTLATVPALGHFKRMQAMLPDGSVLAADFLPTGAQSVSMIEKLLTAGLMSALCKETEGALGPLVERFLLGSLTACLSFSSGRRPGEDEEAGLRIIESLSRMLGLALSALASYHPETTMQVHGKRVAALKEGLCSLVRELSEAATLPETRALLESTIDGFAESDTRDDALPHLQILYEILESSGSPAKQRLIGDEADAVAASLTAFLSSCGRRGAGFGAEAVCVSLRCFESIMARPAMFPLSPMHVATALNMATLLSTLIIHPSTFQGVCSLLAAVIRHRATESRRCMALLTASCQELLLNVLRLGHGDAAACLSCAEGVAHIYVAVSEQKEIQSSYSAHLLADYIVLIASPANPKAGPEGSGQSGESVGSGLPEAVWKKVREGAYALYGDCSPTELQHIYAVLGKTCGGTRKAAMASLRRDYERYHKYTGKV